MPQLAGAALAQSECGRGRKHVARGDDGAGRCPAAAISSSLAREIYGLQIVATNIEDQSNNITRFLVIGNKDSKPGKNDKTSLVFSVKDQPGVLHRMLTPFAKSRINLSKIESRPIKNKPWEYLFFLDLKGHREEPRVKKAIQALEADCVFLKILGSYPSGR